MKKSFMIKSFMIKHLDISFEKFFKMSKLKERPLCLDSVLEMIKKIETIDVSGEELYEKYWITSKTRKDTVLVDHDAQDFNKDKKLDNFFIVSAVVKNG